MSCLEMQVDAASGGAWLSPPDSLYLRQDFSDHLAHRQDDRSDREDVLRLGRQLDVEISETWLEADDHGTSAVLIGAPNSRPSPAVLFLHGGGHAFGDAYSQATELVRWSAELGTQAISVDYRLSPEHPYPAALDDGISALVWLTENAHRLNVSQVFVYGLSAGGGLAAALTLHAVQVGLPVAGLILGSPMLDHRTSGVVAGPEGEDVFTWNHANNRQGWARYLSGLTGTVPSSASPGSASQLPRLPRTYLDVGTRDLFYDEVMEFARKAREAGTDVMLRTWDLGYHGFEVLAPESAAADAARESRKAWLQQAIAL